MLYTNKQKLPKSIYLAIANDPYTRTGQYSASQIPQPVQIVELERRYNDDMEVDVSDRVYPLIGNNTHYILERIGVKNALQEEELTATLDGFLISGKPDLYDEEQIVTDYKICTRYTLIDGVKPDWEAQQNILKWLLNQNGFDVKALKICAIFRDWSKIQSIKQKDYPKKQVYMLDVEMWSKTEVEIFISKKVQQLELAKELPDRFLPHCTPDEIWQKPTKYAVMKKGGKKAVRLLPTIEEAKKYIKDKQLDADIHFIEKRESELTRCEYYCDVQPFCKQYEKAKGR